MLKLKKSSSVSILYDKHCSSVPLWLPVLKIWLNWRLKTQLKFKLTLISPQQGTIFSFNGRKLKQEIIKIRAHDFLFREAVLLCVAKEVYTEKVIIFFKTKK